MSDKKFVVPDGMLKAGTIAGNAHYMGDREGVQAVLEAALRWLAENPIVPTDEQALSLYHFAYRSEGRNYGKYPYTYEGYLQCATEEWQRRMFLAPEPEVPEELKDLLWEGHPKTRHDLTNEYLNKQLLEAYKRGKASK